MKTAYSACFHRLTLTSNRQLPTSRRPRGSPFTFSISELVPNREVLGPQSFAHYGTSLAHRYAYFKAGGSNFFLPFRQRVRGVFLIEIVRRAFLKGVDSVLATSRTPLSGVDSAQRFPDPALQMIDPCHLDPVLPDLHLQRHPSNLASVWHTSVSPEAVAACEPGETDPFFLFACFLAWEQHEDPGAAWELLAAARSIHSNTRAHARCLLASSQHFEGDGFPLTTPAAQENYSPVEIPMKAACGLEVNETCSDCTSVREGFFCGFSPSVLQALDEITHRSTLPAGAILFVEGQSPRGMFILCSGRVNLSTSSREGKTLILKTAEAGEALGLSAAISGLGYETTAETASPCQLSFIDRKHLLELMQLHPEVGMQTVKSLSRDFHDAYRDIRHLVLTRSSAGRLARLLLSRSSSNDMENPETRIPSPMTHEEMAHRIGSSRETVTRLISTLKRRQLIRLEGPTIVIRNRTALEELAI